MQDAEHQKTMGRLEAEGERAKKIAKDIGKVFDPTPGTINGTAVPVGKGECRNCSLCRAFAADPKDYTGRTCMCGHSYYFH
ncbi:MAG: hypothetical protein FWE67_06005 [Planctomycetaceae bacterium]|nr:hypothetical protein [Planctomycetaceae bacterium]